MFTKKSIITSVVFATFVITGCAYTSTVSEESLGLRHTDLYVENTTVPDKTTYATVAPGESKVIERSFENAPPLIPHDIEGMLPITIDNNSCLGCHDPLVASSVGATPLPKSHYSSFRPKTEYINGVFKKEGKVVVNTADIKTVVASQEQLSNARYNCSACHVPQSNNQLVYENNFKADFRSENGVKRSNLIDNLNEGVR